MRERADVLTGLFTRAGVTVDSKRQGNYSGVDVGALTRPRQGEGPGSKTVSSAELQRTNCKTFVLQREPLGLLLN